MVKVFESSDAFAVSLAKATLEEAGIPFLVESNENTARLALGPLMVPVYRFVVPEEFEGEARELLSFGS